MTRDERILKDLVDNMTDKLLRGIGDYVSLCASAELQQRAVMAELMITLIRLTASFAANQFHISPADFAEVVGKQFEHAQRVQAEEEAEDCK